MCFDRCAYDFVAQWRRRLLAYLQLEYYNIRGERYGDIGSVVEVPVNVEMHVTWHIVWQLPYFAIAAAFAILTFYEGDRKGGRWDVFRIAGLVLSLVWPVALVFIYSHSLQARFAKPANPRVFQPSRFKSAVSK